LKARRQHAGVDADVYRNIQMLLGLTVLLADAITAFAQFPPPNPAPTQQAPARVPQAPSTAAISQQQVSGSVAPGKLVPGVLALSMSDSIDRGLKYNIEVLTSDQSTRAAQAARLTALSALLPNLTAQVSENVQQINLKAFGFSGFPGIRSIVGPFGFFDVRAYLTQSILDLSALATKRAASSDVRAAQFAYQNGRDAVVLAVIGFYLQAIAGTARVESVTAQLNTATALFRQATDLRQAGVAAGIDVLRAQVELQSQQQQLIFYRNEFEKQKLSLARAIGLPLEQQFRLADEIPYTPVPDLTLEDALREAYQFRPDYQASLASIRSAEYQKQAARNQRLPVVTFNGNYGVIGPNPASSHGTFTAVGALQVPIFDGGRISGDVMRTDALLEQRRAESGDLRGRVDYEVRSAFLDLGAAREQVGVAQSSVNLANQELQQARDRFQAGVANSVEVVQAQQAVAAADDNYISSLYSYNFAKASLARALGVSEKKSREFLGAKTK
jgi:outer membrane protein TolC